MRLADFARIAGFEVWRDHEFLTPGFLSDRQPSMLTFLDHARFLPSVCRTPEVVCVITTADLAARLESVPGLAATQNPRYAFALLHNHLAAETDFYWAGFATEIDASARVHPRAFVAERNVRIGPGCVIEPNATVLERSLVGEGAVVRSGAVLGAEGFQVVRVGGGFIDMVHAGGIELKEGVRVLCGAVLSPAFFRQATTIGPSTRVGNLVHLSHNVRIGARCRIGHGSMVNGYVTIGDDVWIGPGSTIANGVCIGSGASVSLGSAVISDVQPGVRVTGNVAVEHRRFLRHIASLK